MNFPQYLLRFDDICPTMNWRVWAEIESVLVQNRLKPILAVVPDNRDPKLQVDAPVADFWDRVRAWQDRGWTIGLHGFQHRYVSKNAGMVAVRRKSEFAGLSVGEQREKLQRGTEILHREGIKPRVWIAPGNTFDATTVSLLPEFGIRIICDGYFHFPYVARFNPPADGRVPRKETHVESGEHPRTASLTPSLSPLSHSHEENGDEGWVRGISDAELDSDKKEGMTWIPQQLFYFRPAPAGVWTVCYHHNDWNASRMRQFCEDVDGYGANIASLEEVLESNLPRESKWSAWICTHARLSRFLIRAELKLWQLTFGSKLGTKAADANGFPSHEPTAPDPALMGKRR